MAIRLPCGHNSEWTLRLVDKGQKFRYCFGCMVEKLELQNLNAPREVVIEKQKPKTTAVKKKKDN